jgi:glutamine synthetase
MTETMYRATMEEALPDPQRVAEARRRLEEAGVKYVFSCWIDLLGVPKTKPVPLEEWEQLCRGKGPQFAVHSVSMVPELGPADPDQIPIPDLDSLVVCPWRPGFAWVFADLFYEGTPYDVCPRQALKRQAQRAADAGYVFYAGFEPEFIVMRYTDDGVPVKAFDDDPLVRDGFRPKRQPFGYDAEFALDAFSFLGEIIDLLNGLGWSVKNVVAEGAYSQFELDFGYADAVGAADRLTFLRVLLKEIAKKHGLFATYMSKPTQGDWRNGAHINHSVRSTERPDENLFEADGGWDDSAYGALGGLIRHGAALTAIACSTVNSYKGLIGRAREAFEGGTVTWAPTHICYGQNNRSAMLRLPLTRKAIENRASDMCVNAYLALAMTMGASLEGMTEKIDPGPPIDRPLYDMSEAELEQAGVQHLPANLLEAVTAFDEDPLAKDVLGPTMHNSYSRYKHDEWERFHEHVTDWETTEYLRFF